MLCARESVDARVVASSARGMKVARHRLARLPLLPLLLLLLRPRAPACAEWVPLPLDSPVLAATLTPFELCALRHGATVGRLRVSAVGLEFSAVIRWTRVDRCSAAVSPSSRLDSRSSVVERRKKENNSTPFHTARHPPHPTSRAASGRNGRGRLRLAQRQLRRLRRRARGARHEPVLPPPRERKRRLQPRKASDERASAVLTCLSSCEV